MEDLALKVRISVLWILMAVAMSAHSVLYFLEPDAIAMIESGDFWMGMDPTGMMLFMALFWLVPIWMGFLSVTLNGSTNRWTNIILGIIFTILNIWHLTEHLATASVHQILIIGSTVVATALITWYAYKWKQ